MKIPSAKKIGIVMSLFIEWLKYPSSRDWVLMKADKTMNGSIMSGRNTFKADCI